MSSNKPKINHDKLIDKNNFLEFCHNLYDKLHGKEKINKIFDIEVAHINNLFYLYKTNFIWRENKIFNYIKNHTIIKNCDYNASLFYVNAFQHYLEK
tara:strand:+ start:208 stop:498 length:291 start_codon:yes stop_codon:yes gene_type:complete